LRSGDTLFVRYNRNKQSTLNPNGWSTKCCDGIQDLTGHQGVIQETHVFSPKAVNEFKFAANRTHKSYYDTSQGQDITGQLGLTGIAPGDESLQMTFGNAPRGVVEGPGQVLFDFSIIREFKIRESARAALHVDFFNIFNHANFGLPVTNLTSGTFGVISTAAEPRDIQFGLKLSF
jgi:hypothetical protein